MSMQNAVARLVRDGDTVVIEGFTHLICFAAGHEIIRQRRRDLTLCRLTPDLIYDQMIAAGCARKVVFSWAGNPGVGSLHAFRRAVEHQGTLEIEEYSHFGMVARFAAGAAGLPFWPLRNYAGTDLPRANPRIKAVACPYTGEALATVPALNPDVTIVHAQRADAQGNTQIWGLLGVQKEAAFASQRVIVVVEELVEERVIRSDHALLHQFFHHDDDALRGEGGLLLHAEQSPDLRVALRIRALRVHDRHIGIECRHGGQRFAGVRAGHRLDARIGARQIRPGVVAQRPEGQPRRARAKPCDHAEVRVLLDLQRPALHRPAKRVQRADAGIPGPRKDELPGAAGGDHLIVDQIGREAAQREVAAPLADDLVPRGERDEVGEAL